MKTYKVDLKKRKKPVLKAQNLTRPENRPISDTVRLNGDFKSYAKLYFMFGDNHKQAEVLFNMDLITGWNKFQQNTKRYENFRKESDLMFGALRALKLNPKVPLPAV